MRTFSVNHDRRPFTKIDALAECMMDNSVLSSTEFFGRPLSVVDEIIANKESHIQRTEIKKQNGKIRKLTVADTHLGYIHKSILWKFLDKYREAEPAHGFISNRGVVTNAQMHVRAKSLLTIDLKDFFDNITVDMLKNSFFGNSFLCMNCTNNDRRQNDGCHPSLYKVKSGKYPFVCDEMKSVFDPEYDEKTGFKSIIKRVIDLVTVNGSTPQGFCTSPKISNIIMRGFDNKIQSICVELGVKYTRYADDLSFSSMVMSKNELYDNLYKRVAANVRAFGFSVNEDKTDIKDKVGRMEVCGIVVNEKMSIEKEYRRKLRTDLHGAIVMRPDELKAKRLAELKGKVSWVSSVNADQGRKFLPRIRQGEALLKERQP